MSYVILFVVAFAAGFYAGIKNSNSSKVDKAKSILDVLKGK